MRLTRLAAACAALLCVLGSGSVVAQPRPATGPDPLATGTHRVTTVEYDAQLTTTEPAPAPRPDRLRGVLHLPESGTGPLPVVVFVHGAHEACRVGGSEDVMVQGVVIVPCPGPRGVAEESPSWRGYDYLGSLLASHGYLAVSIDLNWTIALKPGNDIPDRGELVLRTLDLLREWHEGARPLPDGVGALLKGRVDLGRLGLVGHSRGADAIGYVLRQQQSAPPGERYDGLRALVQIAAVDSDHSAMNAAPAGVHLATVVGSCDADTGAQGAALWDRGRFLPAAPASRSLFQLMGANHAFFNSEWYDEWVPPRTLLLLPLNGQPPNPGCTAGEATNHRLSRPDQQRLSAAVIGSFLRRHVGGETAWQGLVSGTSPLPASACPRERHGSGRPLPCSQVLRTSYLAASGARAVLLPTDGGGSAVTTSGAATATRCEPEASPACPEAALDSAAAQYTLGWRGRGTVRVTLPRALDTSGHDALTFRAAMNPSADANRGVAAHELDVCLVDSAGRRSCAPARSAALVRQPAGDGTPYSAADPARRGYRSLVLGGVRVPLSQFRGIARSRIVAVELGVGRTQRSGSLQVAELAVQRTAR